MQSSAPLPIPAQIALKKLGCGIQTARKLRNISQAECAARAHIARGTLAKLEAGDPGVTLTALARVLTVFDLEFLLGDFLSLANDTLGQSLVNDLLPKRVAFKQREPDF